MVYTYRCPACGHKKIHEHSMKVDPVVRCERKVAGGCRCGAVMKRVIPGGGAVLFPMSTRTRGIT
jgi:predicted nucleic acid-binding Zn ribbon protein